MNFFRKNMKTIFLITCIGFIAGIFIGFGGYFFGGRTLIQAVADVNGKKISYRQFTLLYNRVIDNLRDSNTEITEEVMKQKRNEVIQELIQEEVFWQESKKYGIVVTDDEVAMSISRYPAFQSDKRFNQQLYFQILGLRLHMTPQEFEESERRRIAIAKLREFIASAIKITDNELVHEYLIEHQGKLTNFDKEKQEFLKKVRQEKVIALFNEWYKSISSNLKVKVFEDQFK